MSINLVWALIIGGFCYLILPLIMLSIPNRLLQKIIISISLVLFLAITLVGVFGKIKYTANAITISFDFSGAWCAKKFTWFTTTTDMLLNLVFLYPLGMTIYYFHQQQSRLKIFLILCGTGFLCGCFFEIGQFILPIARLPQFTDIICNTISVMLGGIIGWLYLKLINQFRHPAN